FDFEAGQAKVLAADVNGNTRLGAGELIPLDAFLGLAAMRQGRHYVTEDVLALPVRSATDERLLVEGVRSSANVPLISQGKLIGSLNLGMADANMFGEESLEVAREVADQIVAAVQQSQLLAAAQRRVRESEAMAAVSQALNETLNLDQVLQLIANSARQIIPQAEGTVIHLLNEENQTLQPITVTKANQSNGLGLMMRPGEGIAGTVVLEGKLINVGDTRTDTRFLSHGKSSHRALLVAPIQSRVDKVGTITVQSAKSHAFSYADERLLSILGTQAALAIQNARLFEAEQQAHRIAETLRAANQALIQTLDLDKVLNVMLEYMFQLVPYDTAHIMLLEDDTRVVTRASRGYGHWDGNPDWARIIVFNKQHLTLHPILTAQQSVLIPDTREFSGWILQEGSEHVRCWLGVPLQAGGEVIGLYALNKAEPDFFTPEHQQLAESLAAQAAVAVQNALLYKMEREQFYRLQQSQAQLIQAEKMGALGRLVATIAHEVNNPIQAMTGCLTLVTEELDREQDREKVDLYLGIIKSELGRVATIVRNLREFYRSGQERLQPTDLHSVLESVLKLTSKQLQQSSVLVERMWVEVLPTVQANPNHLKQVFLNLILNAIDAMLEGGTLRIVTVLDKMQLRNSLQVVTAVRIEVSDTGIGMPPEIVAHLFEPFFTTKDHGSGLGLSISYSIIEAHNGEFMVSSQVGSGTTFTILLPVTLS
ncbi:MAG: GAF domain-containing protein, partial [Chloroflexi bacterium]|nr:GAF domain-containing protein [Chloroflexota bacterium]